MKLFLLSLFICVSCQVIGQTTNHAPLDLSKLYDKPEMYDEDGNPQTTDFSLPVTISGKQILSSGKIIGFYQNSSATLNGKDYTVIHYYYPDNKKLADAFIIKDDAKTYKLITTGDGEEIDYHLKSDLINEQIEQIAQYLSDRHYLKS